MSQWIDLDIYMKWLAFNFFIRNGDYTDEVYFYMDPATGKYRIIPWDYDDIFASGPHEGSEEKYRNILENITDGYYEVDLAGNLTFFNDSLRKLAGYTRTELMGMSHKEYTDKENAQKLYRE